MKWLNDLSTRLLKATPAQLNLLIFWTGWVFFSLGLAWAWGPLGLIGSGAVMMLVSTAGGRKHE